jgi:hypothetical protein
LIAGVAAIRRIERNDEARAAEVGDHVELIDDLGRTLDVIDTAEAGSHRADEVDPLSDAERRDAFDAPDVEDEIAGLDLGGEPRRIELFVDDAGHTQAGHVSFGQPVNQQLRRRRNSPNHAGSFVVGHSSPILI